MKELFASDTNRAENFHIQWNDFLIDYSKNSVDEKTIDLLLNLANEVHLKEAIASYFDGDLINQTENRAVLHTALRAKESDVVLVGCGIQKDYVSYLRYDYGKVAIDVGAMLDAWAGKITRPWFTKGGKQEYLVL